MIRRRTTAPPGVSNRSQEPVAATRTGDAGSDPAEQPQPGQREQAAQRDPDRRAGGYRQHGGRLVQQRRGRPVPGVVGGRRLQPALDELGPVGRVTLAGVGPAGVGGQLRPPGRARAGVHGVRALDGQRGEQRRGRHRDVGRVQRPGHGPGGQHVERRAGPRGDDAGPSAAPRSRTPAVGSSATTRATNSARSARCPGSGTVSAVTTPTGPGTPAPSAPAGGVAGRSGRRWPSGSRPAPRPGRSRPVRRAARS